MAMDLIYQRKDYRLIATANCYVFEFPSVPQLAPRPLLLGDGTTMHPGDRFTRIGGMKTSAGFTTWHLKSGELIYVGVWRNADGEAVLFRYTDDRQAGVFYGAMLLKSDPLKFSYSTPAVAARIVETTRIERVAPLRRNATRTNAQRQAAYRQRHAEGLAAMPPIYVPAEIKATVEAARQPGETLAACAARLIGIAVALSVS